MKNLIEQIGVVLLCCALVGMGYLIGSRKPQNPPTIETKTKVDTLLVRDTITVKDPVFIYERVVDTLTILISDTVTVQLPVVQREYSDTAYRAWVSGVEPKLDSIKVFPTTIHINTVITQTIKDTHRWGIGPQIGVTYNGQKIQPYFGIGISYSFLQF